MKFVTTDGAGIDIFFKNSTFNGTVIANLGTVTTADIDGGGIDGTTIGDATPAAGTFTDPAATGLALSEGNITDVGQINCDGVSIDAADVGLSLDFSGANSGLSKMLNDNVADALNTSLKRSIHTSL